MLNKKLGNLAASFLRQCRSYAGESGPAGKKVVILGAAGGIGQPLSALMKMNPTVSHLALYDIMGTPGVAADISHINTAAQVTGHTGPDELPHALKGADLVIIPAGVPRKPGMTRQDLFNINAGIVRDLVDGCGKHCPGAVLNIISNPVNSTVPIAAEVLKKLGVYESKRLFGVTTLDVVRAKTFYAERNGLDVRNVDVPVVGGHAGITILPLWSQANPQVELTPEDTDYLTKRTQDGGTEVVTAKAGKGSATLSMAYAGALFADACVRGLQGNMNVVECCFVESKESGSPDVPYFSTRVKLGKEGVAEIYPIGQINEQEQEGMKAMIPELARSIEAGVKFVHEPPPPSQ
eukprot:TRINITY_DN4955_c1_g1_i3.p1 TRINITY_DN4955_c1_g1~~TRINITY_DN4955_c1_g1_i3.p1  ORF type:complete len:375 (-),score=66.70 TRINITY_DN4955_c1_g1_i3:314-1363(-)